MQLLGCVPARFGFDGSAADFERGLHMVHGAAGTGEMAACAQPALASGQWFDGHTRFLVPEFTDETIFTLSCRRLCEEVAESAEQGYPLKVVLLGPLTFLWLGRETTPGFDRLTLLDRLLSAYGELLHRLKALKVEWVQMDEPILGLDLPDAWRNEFERSYWQLHQSGLKLLLTSQFAPLKANLGLACRLPVAGLHVDALQASHELVSIADWLPAHKILSLGVACDGNGDLQPAVQRLQPLLEKRAGQLWLAPAGAQTHASLASGKGSAFEPALQALCALAKMPEDYFAVGLPGR